MNTYDKFRFGSTARIPLYIHPVSGARKLFQEPKRQGDVGPIAIDTLLATLKHGTVGI